MARIPLAMVFVIGLVTGASAQTSAPSDAARAMVGAWEISDGAREKTCPLTFTVEAGDSGFRLELDASCRTIFPALKNAVAWVIGPGDSVRLLDSKGAVILDFLEVETRMYEAERKGEELLFLRIQDAIKTLTINPEQLFGDWTLLKEFENPLCKITLSNASAGSNSYKIIVKNGCDASIAGFAPSTWRLENDELLMSGRTGIWHFAESDATTWERIPPSTDPLVMMRQ
jgi:hypothetical protein